MSDRAERTEEFWRRLATASGVAEDRAQAARLIDDVAAGAELDAADRAFLEVQGPERLLVYRKLMRATLREAVEVALPRTVARLGSAFEVHFAQYCAGGTGSHYLRDVAVEFLDFCAQRWQPPEVPAYLLELGRLEAAQIEVAAAPERRRLLRDADARSTEARPDVDGEPLALHRGVAFAPSCRLLRFRHAVHELPEDVDDRRSPLARDTILFLYRSPEHEVRYLELSPVAAALMVRLLEGAPLSRGIADACATSGVPMDELTLAGAADVLADLARRGAILGAGDPA